MDKRLSGEQAALCALSFFRHRHERVKRFKHSRKPHHMARTVGHFSEYSRTARAYIAEARKLGFHGTFADAAAVVLKK